MREGKGPFADLGKSACDHYWRNYARTAAERAKSFSNLAQYLEWVALQDASDAELP